MFRTRTPLSSFRRNSTARLACVRPPASVHPEPGSNSPLYVCPKLTQSFYALVFPYFFGCYLYFNDLYSFRYIKPTLSVVLICECKSINLFLIPQIFFEKNLKNFLTAFYSVLNHQRFFPISNIYSLKSNSLLRSP